MTITLEQIRAVVRDELAAAMGTRTKPLTAAEACEYLSVSRSTLQEWTAAGRLRPRRMHGNRGRLYFVRSELDAALLTYGRG